MKTCTWCGETKPLEEFYKCPNNADGRMGSCKVCKRQYVKQWYTNNTEWVKQREKRNREEAREERLKVKEGFRVTPAGRLYRVRSRNTAGNAIRDGKLIPQPCIVCGKEKAEGHHFDYDFPLSVVWLCFEHHRIYHLVERKIRELKRRLEIERDESAETIHTSASARGEESVRATDHRIDGSDQGWPDRQTA